VQWCPPAGQGKQSRGNALGPKPFVSTSPLRGPFSPWG
jgi:hypothetical protein